MIPIQLSRQTWIALTSASAFVVLALLLVIVPVPYVIYSPGRAYDVLSDDTQGTPLVRVDGIPSYPTNGELHMTTVAVTRSDARTSLPEALYAYWVPRRDALPRASVYDAGKTSEEVRLEERQMMDTSQQDAIVAAFRSADVGVEELPVVLSVAVSGPSNARLNPGDLILAVNSNAASTPERVVELIHEQEVGDSIRFTVQRDRRIVNVDVIAVAANHDATVPSVGIEVGIGYRYEPTVSFGVSHEIGGPSAGLVFALAIYDEITPDDLMRGRSVAGTGEIDATGRVGRIGGIQEKIASAESVGSTVFLVPGDNCRDLAGMTTDLEIIRVDTLDDAIDGLRNLGEPGGKDRMVPRC